MAKKLKELEAEALYGTLLEEAIKELPEIELKSKKLLEDKPNTIIYENFFDNGKDQTIYHCNCCGHTWTVEERRSHYTYSWRYSGYHNTEEECPKCKQKNPTITPNQKVKESELFSFIRAYNEDEGYAVITTIQFYYKHVAKNHNGYDGVNLDFLENNQEIHIHTCYDSVFSLQYGLRPSSYIVGANTTSNILSSNSADFVHAKYKVIGTTLIENSLSRKMVKNLSKKDIEESALSIIKRIDDDVVAKKEKKAETAASKKKKNDVEEYLNYKAEEVTDEYIIEKSKTDYPCEAVISIIYSDLGGVKKVLSSCSCGHVFKSEIKGHQDNEIVCPLCNSTNARYYSIRKEDYTSADSKVYKYELYELTGELLLRVFNIKRTLRYEGETVEYSVKEKYRFFIGEKGIKSFEYSGSKWEKTRINTLDSLSSYYWSRNYYVLSNTKEEMEELIKKSVFKYSGLLEAWGIKKSSDGRDLTLEDIGEISRRGYIYTWIKNKAIEQVLKTGLINAAKDIMSNPEDARVVSSAKTVFEILDIHKDIFIIARKRNSNLREIQMLQQIYQIDKTINADSYQQIDEIGATNTIIQLAQQFNIPFKKILEYLDSCYNNQCIEKAEALKIWFDYLKMATDMDYRLDDSSKKFPGSLKKEHDRATFSYKVVKEEMNSKRFTAQAEINKAALEYSYEDLFVKVPTSPTEVVKEGTDQHHCVASYVSRIRDGSTAVCFIRRKDQPDIAYYTAEVCDGEIVQVRGLCNCAPKGSELLTFIRKWAERKKLKCKF